MSPQSPRKQPRKPKQLKLTITEKDKWHQILRDVEKNEAPVSVLKIVKVNLIDGTKVSIKIQELLAEGLSPDEVEMDINRRLDRMGDIIKSVDFFISVDHVAREVQPATDNLLKNL